MKQYLLPEKGQFYKVNMHAHTTSSDGSQTPEEVKALYKSMGYSAVAFTEHEIMLDYSHLSDDGFIALTAYEYGFDKDTVNRFPGLYTGKQIDRTHTVKVHLNLYSKDPHDVRMVCCNLKYIWGNSKTFLDRAEYVGDGEYQRRYSAEGVNEVIKAAKDRDMLVIYNHPNWSMTNGAFHDKLENLTGLEIINGDGGTDSDMEDVPYVYQEMARAGKRLICVAGDDNHSTFGSGLAWTMVKADSLTYENLMRNIENGNCYASNGPEIRELYVEDGKVHVKTSDAVGIYLHTAGRRTGAVRSDRNGGMPVNEGHFRLEPTDVMFRVSVRDAAGNHAYSRYYYLDELDEPAKNAGPNV